jgi:hypothetical protein
MFLVKPVFAQCPVCIVTVGGGMILAEKLGIDSLLINIWIGGLNTVIAYWLASKFKNRILQNPVILSLILYGLTIFYFSFTNQIGENDTVFGIDKIVLGETLGLIAVIIGNFINIYTKRKNHNKVLFYYQKVVFPVSLLILTTIVSKLIFNL